MAIDCTPKALAASAKCFCGVPPGDRDAIMLYLLASINGGSMDPTVLAGQAKAFLGVRDEQMIESMKVYLLCAIASKLGA